MRGSQEEETDSKGPNPSKLDVLYRPRTKGIVRLSLASLTEYGTRHCTQLCSRSVTAARS